MTGELARPPVWDNRWLEILATAGEILAISRQRWSSVWRRNLGSPAHSQPSLAADRVYVPVTDGRVVALRIDTGDPVWERRLGGPATGLLALDEHVCAGSVDNFPIRSASTARSTGDGGRGPTSSACPSWTNATSTSCHSTTSCGRCGAQTACSNGSVSCRYDRRARTAESRCIVGCNRTRTDAPRLQHQGRDPGWSKWRRPGGGRSAMPCRTDLCRSSSSSRKTSPKARARRSSCAELEPMASPLA